MMTKCPKCDSTEVIPELSLFGSAGGKTGSVFVSLLDPSGRGENVSAGFRADICGNCGYTEFYSKKAPLLLEAHKKDYISYKIG
jgi:predicted nucleic-acid-binding Zn-ribbon protein